jgi:YD repeat-containing protein
MKCGSLNKITYPTGGSTEFDFEPHNTPVSYLKYTANYLQGISMGYGGNQNTQYFNITFATNVHKFRVSNSSTGGKAFLTTPAGVIDVDPGATVERVQEFPPGTYSISLYKIDATSGNGCEANCYDMLATPVEENAVVGGLRIKKITNKDAITTNNKVTNFSYVDDVQKSTGVLYSRPTYLQSLRNDILGEVGLGGYYPNGIETPFGCPCASFGGNGLTSTAYCYIVDGSSTRPLDVTQGGHIGYSRVKISELNNGYKEYRYYGSNYWDLMTGDVCVRNLNSYLGCNSSIPNFPEADLPYDYKRGELKAELAFKENGQLINSADYYLTFEENLGLTPCVKVASIISDVDRQATFFDMKTYKKKETKKIEYSFDNLGNTISNTTTTYFESPYHNQPTRLVSLDSKGNTTEQKLKNVYDFNPACSVSIANQDYINNLASIAGQYQYSISADNSSDSRRAKWQNYQGNINSIRSVHVTRLLNEAASFSTCFSTSKNNADISLKPILELRSKFMNPQIESSTWKNGKLLSSTFSKYDYVTNPANFPYPSKIQSIKLATPTTTFTPSVVSGNTITKDSRYQDEVAVKFDNGNMVEALGKDAITTSYIWGYNNTLPIVKATGINYATLKAAYDAVAGNLTTIRTQPSLSTAFINTYFYTLGVGMTSETDPNGHSKYYEYDALNRLTLVRDQDNNILKKICYNYAGQVEDCPLANSTTAQWRATGNTRCQPCPADANYNSGIREKEEKDINPNSPTYTSAPRWVIDPSGTCPVLPNYQPNSFPVCQQNNGVNTGYLITTTADVNPCSNPPNQPGPPILTPSASCIPCNPVCTTPQYQCINGICVQGVLKVVKVRRISKALWECTSAYCFPSSTGTINNDSYTIGSSTYTVVTTGSNPCEIECF